MMTTSSKHLSKILIVILGVMTAFGPLTIDMYGPSLPKVQHALLVNLYSGHYQMY